MRQLMMLHQAESLQHVFLDATSTRLFENCKLQQRGAP
jgi:hypothetical protein